MKTKVGLLLVILLLRDVFFLFGQKQDSKVGDQKLERELAIADSLHQHSWEKSIQFLDSLSMQNQNDENLGRIYLKIASILNKEQFYESSLKYLEKALNPEIQITSGKLLSELNLESGKVHRRLGNYDQAIKYDLNALRLVEQMDDPGKKALIFNYIGIDHYRYHNYTEAVKYFKHSLEIRKQINDSIGIADCWNNLGMVYDDMNKQDSALIFYQKSLDIYKSQNEYDGIAAANNNMAGIYYHRNDLQQVMKLMNKSLEIRRKGKDKRKLSFTLLNTASLYYSQGDMEKSLQLNLEGLQLAEQIGAKSQKKIAYEGLSDVYYALGNYKKAHEYQVLYNQVKDSIFEENKSRAIAEMNIRFETEKKEIENQFLRNENKAKTRNIILLLFLAMVLIALVFLLIYYLRLRNLNLKQQKELTANEISKKEQEKKHLEDKVFAEKQINKLQKDKYESELELKNKQLMSSTLNLVNKNEVLGSIKNRISSLDLAYTDKREVISMINQNLDVDANWKSFRLDFEEVHPGFFNRLNDSYPGLSETYQKICAYLRIDLTSKEIADLMNVSIAAVNKNRQRLRKKLNLPAEANLKEFLSKM